MKLVDEKFQYHGIVHIVVRGMCAGDNVVSNNLLSESIL